MPTYQYACTDEACDLRFERVQSFTDAAISECPNCGHRVRKVYGSVGVVFKGSGFYRNDSREASSSVTPAKSESGSSESNGKSESKSDSAGKSETKSDSGSSSPAKTGSDSGSGSGSGSGAKSDSKASAPAAS